MALIWHSLVAEIWISSPPNDSISLGYSLSGSMIIISAFGSLSVIETISFFAVKDLPEPDTPKIKELPFNNSLLSAIIIFLLITFSP